MVKYHTSCSTNAPDCYAETQLPSQSQRFWGYLHQRKKGWCPMRMSGKQVHLKGLPRGHSGQRTHLPMHETRVQSLSREDPWRKKSQPTLVFSPGESHGQKSLAGYSPWRHKESDPTAQLSTHTNTKRSPGLLENCWCHFRFVELLYLKVIKTKL